MTEINPIDPLRVNTQVIQSDIDTVEAIDEREEQYAALQEQQREQAAQQAALEEQNKPVNVVNEVGNALAGGAFDAVSDIVTIPERVIDMFNGEMEEEGIDYKPETDDWINPERFETRTWWGGLLRGTVNMASLLIPIGGQLRGAGAFARYGPKAAMILRGAAAGAAVDTITRSSTGDNMSRMLIDHVPQLDSVLGPLATNDSDHPAMRILKNVVEGLGIGIIFDVALSGKPKPEPAAALPGVPDRPALPPVNLDTPEVKAVRSDLDRLTRQRDNLRDRAATEAQPVRAGRQEAISDLNRQIKDAETRLSEMTTADTAEARIIQRNDDVRVQTVEKGRDELKFDDFGEYKNKPIAERHQGSPLSRSTPSKVAKQLDDIDTRYDAKDGSTDSMVTPLQAQRMAETSEMSVAEMKKIAKGVISDSRIEAELARYKGSKTPWRDAFPQAFKRMEDVMNGREVPNMSGKEFWSQFEERMVYDNRGVKASYMSEEDLLTADLVIGSLFKQMRDLGVASRELADFVNLKDGTGPVKSIADRLVVGMFQVKKSRYLRGLSLQELNVGPREVTERLAGLHDEAKQSVKMMTELMGKDPSDNVTKAFIEYFSMANKINNWTDLDAFLRAKIRGGQFDGKKIEGALTKELSSTMVHSILSGPKTPVRAILGTSLAATTRTMAQVVGGVIRLPFTGDISTARAALAGATGMLEAVPEAMKLFQTRLKGYWTGDVATMKTRFSNYTKRDEEWAALAQWSETRGTNADKAAFRIANVARELNNNSFLTYSTKLMAATDDAFQVLLARSRAKEKAMREALENSRSPMLKVDEKVLAESQDRFYRELLDEEGNINLESDVFLQGAVKEATLTTELSGFAASLEKAFSVSPWTRPFFLFARTGVNGLALTMKNTPILNLALKRQRDILLANPNNIESLLKYGITNAADLANEKALMAGRQAIGSAVVLMASQKYMAGEITGNGPQDRSMRRLWIDAGWKPMSIKIGGQWVSYESFEPFNLILAGIADLGDHQQMMGEEFVENGLLSMALTLAGAAVSKSYLSSLEQFTDLLSGDERVLGQVAGNLINNTVPLGGLRNEIGKALSPGMREINGSIMEQIRNRNQLSEHLAGEDQLPVKTDILSGKPVRDYEWATRMWNFFSPVAINPDVSPGREMLFESQYDIRETTVTTPNGFSLSESPEARALFQYEIGQEGLDQTLNELAAREDVQASLQQMRDDIAAGRRDLSPMNSYLHNDLIKQAFRRARRRAWARIQNHPTVEAAIAEQRDRAQRERQSRRDSSQVQKLINMPK